MALFFSIAILFVMYLDAFLFQIGLILMKQAFLAQEKSTRKNNRPGYLQWKWLLGFFLVMGSSSVSMVA
jgi:hypothetical protein